MYIYIVCVCVCVCVLKKNEEKWAKTEEKRRKMRWAEKIDEQCHKQIRSFAKVDSLNA